MGRENEERFKEGDNQHRDHDDRHRRHDLAKCTCGKKQGCESGHRCEHPNGDGGRYPQHARQCSAWSGLACLLRREDIFTGDNCIIHHDAQHDDQGEKAHHGDGDAEQRGDHQTAEKRNGDPHTGPEGELQVEKQNQRQENECKAQNGVAQQKADPVSQDVCLAVGDGKFQPLRQGYTFQIGVDLFFYFQRVLIAGA